MAALRERNTSHLGAGVTAGIDLSLAPVEEDLGRAVALAVARYLVVFLKLPGGQAQFSAALSLQSVDGHFAELHGWLAEHLGEALSLSRMATRAGMSGRFRAAIAKQRG